MFNEKIQKSEEHPVLGCDSRVRGREGGGPHELLLDHLPDPVLTTPSRWELDTVDCPDPVQMALSVHQAKVDTCQE